MELEVKNTLLPLAIFMGMVGIGIELQWRQFRALFTTPLVPVLGTLVQTLSFPVVAVCMVSMATFFSWPMSEALMAGILLVAACPSGGFSNILTSMAKGDVALSVALTTISSLLSFVSIPLLLYAFSVLIPSISQRVEVPVASTLMQLLVLVVIPSAIGMAWRHKRPAFVERHLKALQNRSQLFIYVVIVLVVYQQWGGIREHVASALPWAVAMCIAGIALGYLCARLVKLPKVTAATVAIEGSIRNLTVAFLIATTVLGRIDVAAFPMVYFAAVLFVGIGFALLWKRWGVHWDGSLRAANKAL